MPRPRSAEFMAVINALEESKSDLGDRVFTLEDLRSSLESKVSTFGAGGNFLRRAVQEACVRGEIRSLTPGTFRFLGGGSASSEPMGSDVDDDSSTIDSIDGMFTPKVDKTFKMPKALQEYIPAISKRLDRGEHQKFRVTGPAGCGKTEGGIQVAAQLGLDVLIVDCSIIREPRDFFGSRTVRDGKVVWVDSQFSRAVAKGNCMIILDEINRCSDLVGNALLPLLDSRRATLIEERGSVLKCGDGIVWWATANEGAAYTGTGAMDRAVQDRFQRTIEFSYLPREDEIDLIVSRTGISGRLAANLVEVATKTRLNTDLGTGFTRSVSTRQLIAAAEDLRDVGSMSLQYTITNTFAGHGGADSERSMVANLLVGQDFSPSGE